MSDIHSQIMNLPCTPATADELQGYRRGHRDARHAAAEIVAPYPALLQMLHECAEYIAALNGEQDDYCQRARALIARATGEVK